MRYLSLFSGIEAASVAWEPLGWECAAVAEIEKFPCAVLAHRFPHVPNLGDVSRIGPEEIAALGRIDLVVFGSPCQDLSIAGKRKGLAGERSGLFHIALDIVRWAREYCGCRWALWENVPGAFSSNKGRDFAAVVEQMAGLDDCPVPPKGWGTEGVAVGDEAMVEWAVLDAQWFGVAQRRRRVFALADFGDWADRPPVLLEPQGLRGDTAPRRGQGAGFAAAAEGGAGNGGEASVAATLSARDYKSAKDLAVTVNALTATGVGTCGADDNQAQAGHLDPTASEPYTLAIRGRAGGADLEHRQDGTSNAILTPSGGRSGAGVGAVAVQGPSIGRQDSAGPQGSGVDASGAMFTLTKTDVHAVAMRVRRLTPSECEALQGLPRGWTQVPYRNKPAADGPRYKAIGNSFAVPVVRWIGQQIDLAASDLV